MLIERKDFYMHRKEEGKGIGINLSELDFQEPKQFLSRHKKTGMKIDNAAIEAGAQCRKIVMDG